MSLVRREFTDVIIALWRTLLNNGEDIMSTSYFYLTNATEQQ